MDKWPLGVFASIDAGLGVQLEVAHELGVPTIHLHAPQQASAHASRTPSGSSPGSTSWASASRWSSAASRGRATPTSPRSPAPSAWCRRPRAPARITEMKEIADFARLLGVDAVGLHLGFVPARPAIRCTATWWP